MSTDDFAYGQLVLFGTNGKLDPPVSERSLSKLTLYKRKVANGVVPGPVTMVPNSTSSAAVCSFDRHSVAFTLCRTNTVVVEYLPSSDYDLFQIGRCAVPAIDFVVAECPQGSDTTSSSVSSHGRPVQDKGFRLFRPKTRSPKSNRLLSCSTVSRFACRIDINRNPPHEAKIYAAGFDMQKNIFLGEKAIKWRHDGIMDGFTTNGVRILRPTRTASNLKDNSTTGHSSSNVESLWREVSVNGHIYKLYSSLFVPNECDRLPENNILEDGTLIDLSGSLLLWRSSSSLSENLTLEKLSFMVDILNQTHVHCPVLYNTLRFKDNLPGVEARAQLSPSGQENNLTSTTFGNRQPYIYLNCGHVHGWHSWRHGNDGQSRKAERTCPLCRQASHFVPLAFGEEVAFYIDCGPPTHCFNPCGHIASEATVRHWCSLKLPTFETAEMKPRCPFCGVTVSSTPVRLILQHDADEDVLRIAFSLYDSTSASFDDPHPGAVSNAVTSSQDLIIPNSNNPSLTNVDTGVVDDSQ